MHVNRSDIASLRSWMRSMEDFAENRTIPVLANANKAAILGLTAQGADAFGEIFHDYGPAQREKRLKAGKQVDVKDLSFSGDMLASLGLYDNMLTVADGQRAIAYGQMTGHSGKWGYEHVFLATSDETDEAGLDALLQELQLL